MALIHQDVRDFEAELRSNLVGVIWFPLIIFLGEAIFLLAYCASLYFLFRSDSSKLLQQLLIWGVCVLAIEINNCFCPWLVGEKNDELKNEQ